MDGETKGGVRGTFGICSMRPVKPHIRVEFRRNGLWYENGGGGSFASLRGTSARGGGGALNSPLVVRYMLRFSAPHRRKSPFNLDGPERHSIRTTIRAALISDAFKFQMFGRKEKFQNEKKKISMERFFFLFFFTRRPKKGQSRKKKKKLSRVASAAAAEHE